MLLELKEVKKHFQKRIAWNRIRTIRAVDGVSFGIHAGETFGLVGESGSGKTTLARLIMGMLVPTGGTVLFDAQDLGPLGGDELLRVRRRMGIVFQNPYNSLNPRMMVRDLIAEPLAAYGVRREDHAAKVISLMQDVGLRPELHLHRYPHEFSGGQRQRIAIARTLSYDPQFIILDEPTSALDVSVQAQILNLLGDLQRSRDITYLLISHNMGVIRHMCTRVAVMYLGRVVELGPAEEIFARPLHPYTVCLIDSIPDLEASMERPPAARRVVSASNAATGGGCLFAPRCPRYKEDCAKEETPPLREVDRGHLVACHYI